MKINENYKKNANHKSLDNIVFLSDNKENMI